MQLMVKPCDAIDGGIVRCQLLRRKGFAIHLPVKQCDVIDARERRERPWTEELSDRRRRSRMIMYRSIASASP
jgi:hypothetical protein